MIVYLFTQEENMFKIAVCDDDAAVVKTLYRLIQTFARANNYEVDQTSYLNPEMLIADMEDGAYYDIIYIDIEMPQMNGIEAIKTIKRIQPSCLIIILSSYTQYAIHAINLEVFRYLVKGHTEDLFDVSLQSALNRLSFGEQKSYCISSPRKHIKIITQDILYCYKNSKMSVIVTKNENYQERKSLYQLLEDLNSVNNTFIMIERSYVVNILYIRKIWKNELILDSGEHLPIGKTFMNSVKDRLDEYWREQL